jgi:hypothetical protein
MIIWNFLSPFGIFYCHLVYILIIYSIFFLVLVCFTKKNLATLPQWRFEAQAVTLVSPGSARLSD